MKSMFPLMYGNALKHRQRRCVKNVHRPFFSLRFALRALENSAMEESE